MKQSSRTASFLIPWYRLLQTVTRQRATPTRTERGKDTHSWTAFPHQVIRGSLQPQTGNIAFLPEGLTQDTTHILYCNLVTEAGEAGVPVEIQPGDRIVDAGGVRYRVLFAENAAGMNHHYEVLLSTKFPEGD